MSARLRTMLTEKVTRVLDDVKDDLGDLYRTEIREATEDLAELTLQQLTLTDEHELRALEREVLHAKARVANWSFVGADLVRARLKAAFHETAEVIGALLKGFIK